MAPAPITFTDASTIATNAALGNLFRVTLAGNRTPGAPTNPTDGQRAMWELIQDATGSRTLTLNPVFALGTTISSVTLTTGGTKTRLPYRPVQRWQEQVVRHRIRQRVLSHPTGAGPPREQE
ncbi:hypothetical protein [Streptomyces anandii]|uniref:hypothetical protein n=1 Tax=Streptomyces anandii TaxID=285454 RepID=UPI001675D6CA|nr:hypothetical protein [Streptomyces anandii]GGY13636.1 hypothetical protein GCM10010510_69600 [Streptomyces anandii JCM 4720]